jgi:hypothetical protein
MSKHRGEASSPTLGVYVSGLHLGSACICCGASLQWADSHGLTPSPEEFPFFSNEGQVLVCPDCGSEVGSVFTGEMAPRASRTLNRAA